MKFTANGYEIEIKARRIDDNEFNVHDTRRVLIDLSCFAGDAADMNKACECFSLAEEAESYRRAFSRAYRELERRIRNEEVEFNEDYI